MYYNTNDYRDYLAHHGILGQKWGKKNGPPYPLGYGDHSASEKRAGWRKSLKTRHRQKRIASSIKRSAESTKGFRSSNAFKAKEFKKDLDDLTYSAVSVMEAGNKTDKKLREMFKNRDDVVKAAEGTADTLIKEYGLDKRDDDESIENRELTQMYYEDAAHKINISAFPSTDDYHPRFIDYSSPSCDIYEFKLKDNSKEAKECNKALNEQCETIHTYFQKANDLSEKTLGKYKDVKVNHFLNRPTDAGTLYTSELLLRSLRYHTNPIKDNKGNNVVLDDLENALYNPLIVRRYKEKYGESIFEAPYNHK